MIILDNLATQNFSLIHYKDELLFDNNNNFERFSCSKCNTMSSNSFIENYRTLFMLLNKGYESLFSSHRFRQY